MKKLAAIWCFTLFFVSVCSLSVHAQNIKSTYEQLGFIEGTGAVQQFEEANSTKLDLPKKQPTHKYTQVFSRFKNYQGIINDRLEIIYKFHTKEEGMYIISVAHKEAILPYVKNNRKQQYTLENGTSAYYFNDTAKHFQLLIFQHDDYQYIIGCNESTYNGMTVTELLDIANSI